MLSGLYRNLVLSDCPYIHPHHTYLSHEWIPHEQPQQSFSPQLETDEKVQMNWKKIIKCTCRESRMVKGSK